MTRSASRRMSVVGLAALAWASGAALAEAVVGRPATPVSYAGVARRSTVGAGAPGVGVTPGVGVGAPGVGVAPGVVHLGSASRPESGRARRAWVRLPRTGAAP